MRATVERAEALRLLKIEHQAVEALIAELSDEEMTRGDTIRHGLYYDQECSFKDLLAHLVCYEVIYGRGAARVVGQQEALGDRRRE